jgi:YidC/Oxa1 family membrane protein insertase
MGQIWEGLQKGLGAIVSVFYQAMPNLGVAVILLTIAVGVLLFPLTLKQTRSMRAMQEMQPELKRLQKEHAGDKQAMQQATMALYKERGVNPAAGCLPLLLQMPIWFALYRVLRSFASTTVEDAQRFVVEGWRLFREIGQMGVGTTAGWKQFLWMDLGTTPRTAFDLGWVAFIPYVVTVLLVMGTAWYQQAQTTPKAKEGQPATQQPGQAILKIFPVFFGFISFTLPAGLVVYFAASNIFRIGQQSLILWLDGRRRNKVTGVAGVVVAEREPEIGSAPRPAKPSGTPKPQPRVGGAGGSTRSPQASQQRGKKRRRR